MEVNSFSSDLAAFGKIVVNSVLEAVVSETLLVAQRSVACLLVVVIFIYFLCALIGDFLFFRFLPRFPCDIFWTSDRMFTDGWCSVARLLSAAPLSESISPDSRFPFESLYQENETCRENKDGNDTEDDDEDDNGDAEDQDEDNDEDFSGEEGGDDDDEGDPEKDPAANCYEGSDDDGDDNDEEVKVFCF